MVAFWRGSQVHLSWSKYAVEGTASLGVRLTEFGVLENSHDFNYNKFSSQGKWPPGRH